MLNRLALGLAVPAAALALLTVLLLPHGASAAAPANDNKADASIVVALPFTDNLNNSSATTEQDEPKNCNFTTTVWYKLTSPISGRIIVNTYGSSFDTGLAVYTQANDLIVCNDDYSSVQSKMGFDAQMGQVYWVQAGGYSGRTGDMVVNIAPASDFAQITGTVRSAADSTPLADICVNLYSLDHQRRGYTSTIADGTYALEGIVAGEYAIAFTDCGNDIYAGSYYSDALTIDDAQTITLTAAQVRSGIDANLAVGGTLSGKVTDADTGLPIDNICIYANTADYDFHSSTDTSADGIYMLTGLGNDYTIQFENCGSSEPQYVALYYPGVLNQNDATEVHAVPGDALTGYDMELHIGASISGAFTNGITEKPLADVCVAANLITGNNLDNINSVRVDNDGTYTLNGLPAGQFKVNAYQCGVPKFGDVWYDGKPTSANATVLTLAAGQAVTGIDFSIILDPIAGDGDCTGDVTMSDLMTGLQYLGGVDGGHNCASSSLNLDCNGVTNGRDMLVLVRYLSNLPMTVPVNCPTPGTVLP